MPNSSSELDLQPSNSSEFNIPPIVPDDLQVGMNIAGALSLQFNIAKRTEWANDIIFDTRAELDEYIRENGFVEQTTNRTHRRETTYLL